MRWELEISSRVAGLQLTIFWQRPSTSQFLKGASVCGRPTMSLTTYLAWTLLHGSPFQSSSPFIKRFPTLILVRGKGRPCRRCSCSSSPAEPARKKTRLGLRTVVSILIIHIQVVQLPIDGVSVCRTARETQGRKC